MSYLLGHRFNESVCFSNSSHIAIQSLASGSAYMIRF